MSTSAGHENSVARWLNSTPARPLLTSNVATGGRLLFRKPLVPQSADGGDEKPCGRAYGCLLCDSTGFLCLHTCLLLKHLQAPRMSNRVPEGNASSTRISAPASSSQSHCVGRAKDHPRHVRLGESISSLATNAEASPRTGRAKIACPRPSNPVAFESTHDAAMRSWAASRDCNWSEVTHTPGSMEARSSSRRLHFEFSTILLVVSRCNSTTQQVTHQMHQIRCKFDILSPSRNGDRPL
ncbi:hypothetical protein EDB86DRAFT_3245385, partial [Lactarius hatsudake]